MKVRRFKRAIHLTVVTALTAGGLLVTFAPSTVEAATFTTVPTRLYMAPAGVSIPNGVAQLVGVQVGTLKFDGTTDPISQQLRSIVVNTVSGDALCDLTVSPYDIGDCSRIQIGPVSHGRLSAGAIDTIPDGESLGVDVYLLPSGARIESEYQVANGSNYLALNGTPEDLNEALAALVYTPDSGYYYEGSNGEDVNIVLVPGNSDDNLPPNDTTDDTANATIQIRVLKVNGFPTVTAPSDKSAQAGIEFKIPVADPAVNPPFAGRAITVTDADNDEDVDGAQANPPVAEGALQDGAGSKMLLIGYLACDTPTTDLVNGFHFRGGTFEVSNNDIRSIVRDFFQFTQLPSSGQTIVTTLLDAIDAIEPGLTTTTLATNSPTTYTSLFAGVGSMYEVQYAVSQISFLQPAAADNCTMWTIVSDLGNNGLPLQYFGDPPTGIEVPMIGLGLDSFDINTGDLDEIDISFVDPSTLVINESGAPVDVIAAVQISPAIHPEFVIQWEINPKNGDPEVVGVATADDDFRGTFNNTLTVPENAVLIQIPNEVLPDPPNTTIYADSEVEGNETFTFDLVVDPNAEVGYLITSSAPSKTVVIVDDDDPVQTISVDNPSIVEGDSGTRSLTFTLTLDGLADGNESVLVSTVDGTATDADNDYEPVVSELVQFATGETEKTVTVTVNGDLVDELGAVNEALTLQLSGATNVTVGTPSGIGAIVNDDQPRTVTVADASKVEGNAGTSVLNFVVTLNTPAKGNESVTVSTADGSATIADNDYAALTNAPITFVAGATTATASVTINGDVTPEANETFTFTLGSNVNVLIDDGSAIGTIQNDDGVPNVSINDVMQNEGNAGTATFTFTVSLSAPAVAPAAISVVSANGTATAGSDYVAFGPQTFTFGTGESSKLVTVVVNGDTTVELNETFTVLLSNPDQVLITDGTGLGTITNDDVTPSVMSIADATVTEGAGVDQAVISMTNPAGRTCAVTVTSVNGTAVAPGDFTALVGGLVTLTSVASANGAISVVNDQLVEANETFTINLALHASSNPACELGDNSATITIVSDDLASVVSIADATVTEGAAVDRAVVSMTNPAGHVCVVTVTSVNGTAVAPDDFAAFVGGQFTINQVPSANLPISVVNDLLADAAESFVINLALHPSSNPACVLGDSSATILIVDDDSPADATAPTVTVEQGLVQADPTTTSPIEFRATFSEPVIGFGNVAGDVVLAGTSNGTKVATITGGPLTFTVSVAVTGATNAGTVIASIPAGAANDGTNLSLASTSADNSVVFDQVAPTATINQAVGQTDPTTTAPIVFDVVFSEPVTGFANGDITLNGTAAATTATVTGSGTTYTVSVTGMTGAGTVLASIAAGVAQDAATNNNLAATSIDNSVQFDVDQVAPVPLTLTINPPANITVPNAPGLAGANVSYPMATSTGGVPPIAISCLPASGTFYLLGTTTVTCTATDSELVEMSADLGAAAIATGTFTITVVDTEPPVIGDGPDLTLSTDGSSAIATYTKPPATDNGGPPTVVCTPSSLTSFFLGVTTVTCTATDGAGLTASSSFTVTVITGLQLPATGSSTNGSATMALAFMLFGFLLLTVTHFDRRRPRPVAAGRRRHHHD